jgi:hypothetical protein
MPPKSGEQKQREKDAREAEKQTGRKSPPKKIKGSDPKKPKGGDAPAVGQCVWDASQLRVQAWTIEPTIGDDYNILHLGDSEHMGSGAPIERDCFVRLEIKNDFVMGLPCYRRDGFTKPHLSTEITFNKKVLFSKKDSKPWANVVFAEPAWGSFIELLPIRESGTLHIVITMFDPDTGTTRILSEKTDIKIITKDKCCDCVS